jgi:hypothetical protein
VWCVCFYKVHVDSIEIIQRKFIRFALSRLSWLNSVIFPPYIGRCKLLENQPLKSRQINFDFERVAPEKCQYLGIGSIDFSPSTCFEHCIRFY